MSQQATNSLSEEETLIERLAELLYLMKTNQMKISELQQFSHGMEQKEGYTLNHKNYYVWLVRIDES